MGESKRVVIVTGANRGIGLATAYLFAKNDCLVVLACRSKSRGARAAHLLKQFNLNVQFNHVDVADLVSCQGCVEEVMRKFGKVDILVNNAGIFEHSGSAMECRPEFIKRAFAINTIGAIQMIQSVAPFMKARGFGSIVNVSSGMGSLTHAKSGSLPYRLSKAALNMATVVYSDELKADGVFVNSVCPGWVRTRITSGARRRPVEAAHEVVFAAFSGDSRKTGRFLRGEDILEW